MEEDGEKDGVEKDGVERKEMDSFLGSLSRGDFKCGFRDLKPRMQNSHHQTNAVIREGTLRL